ncbi:MAG: 2-C-methyl-D-erythritol 2,4-cyclodiphosphate synthase [Panacagrimonas sp.]
MFRIGHGYDVHRLSVGKGIRLGGVEIACDYSLIAHSDGDVLIHALCDAMLGALALGDIGKFFPDDDPQYRDIDSRRLLRAVVARIRAMGYSVCNVDATVIAQTPRLSPFIQSMRQTLAGDLAMETAAVSVKATTHEGIGSIGRQEGIAAHAVVLLQKNRG